MSKTTEKKSTTKSKQSSAFKTNSRFKRAQSMLNEIDSEVDFCL